MSGRAGSTKNGAARRENQHMKSEGDLAETPVQLGESDFGDSDSEGIVIDEKDAVWYKDGDFRIKQINDPDITVRTIKDLYKASFSPYLRLDPEYQRDVVWDEKRSSELISSILQGYYIPPLIFNVIQVDRGSSESPGKPHNVRVCVDGKQRLTSIIKFMQGSIGVYDHSMPRKKWYYCHPIVDHKEINSSHNILPPKAKDFFRNKTLVCSEFTDLPDAVEETMFQLVQRGVPLTPAEKLRAISTRWAAFAKQYEEDYSSVLGLNRQNRGAGFRMVVSIFAMILEIRHPSRKRSKSDNSKPVLQASPAILAKFLKDNASFTEAAKSLFKCVFDRLEHLIELSSEPNPKTGGTHLQKDSPFHPTPTTLDKRRTGDVKSFSPIELLSSAVLVAMHGKRTDDMLLGDIMEVRHQIRLVHKDLRMKQEVWNTAWKYIDVTMIRLRSGEETILIRNDRERVRTAPDDDDDDDDDDDNASFVVSRARRRPKIPRTGTAFSAVEEQPADAGGSDDTAGQPTAINRPAIASPHFAPAANMTPRPFPSSVRKRNYDVDLE